MDVLITGASGFLGGQLAEECLEKGDEVHVLVRTTSDLSHLQTLPGLVYHYGDLGDKKALLRACAGREAVYHSAALASESGTWQQHHEANYLGTMNVLTACLAVGVRRLVFVSSPTTIFDFRDHRDIDESYPYPARFANAYAETKARAEQEVIEANGRDGLTTTSLRPHAIWGPRDTAGFIPQFVSALTAGKFRSIGRDREVLVDLCHVSNAAHACRLAGQSDQAGGKIYFITDEEPISIWPFVDHCCDVLGVPKPGGDISPATAMRIAGLVESVWRLPWLAKKGNAPLTRYKVGILTRSGTYDISAARRDLGYARVIGVEEGLAQLKQWIDANGGIPAFISHVKR